MKKKLSAVIMSGMLVIPLAVLSSGCSSNDVAATIDGDNIMEQTITDYIQNYRKAADLENDDDWAKYLVSSNMTASTMRDQAIDYYERQEVIKKDAASKGITVSTDDVNSQIEDIKNYYGYDDAKLEEQVKKIGYTMDSYREYVQEQLLEQKLSDNVTADVSASDDDILKMAQSYKDSLNGSKELKVIVFNSSDADKAQDVMSQAKGSDDATFDKLAHDNTTTSEYDGWDCMITEDKAVTNVVADMNKGDVSDVITGTGNLYVVKVVDVFTVGDDGITSVEQLPTSMKSSLAQTITDSQKLTKFSQYVNNLLSQATKSTNAMPSGLPYDVDTSNVSTNTASGTSTSPSATLSSDSGSVSDDGSTVSSDDGTVSVESVPAESVPTDGTASEEPTTNDAEASTGNGE